MTDPRPDPDRLLAAITRAADPRRGRLKVYLGAAAGVGKTVAMLRAARLARAAGRDVVVGVVETHGRAETQTELGDLEVVARRASTRAGAPPELDLDAVLQRNPAVVIIDELAHSNSPGGRHPKRWQDVLELVAAGLEVWTAVNIQHLESLNDVVERLTGVRVHETVPDHVLEDADEIELIDLTPEDLHGRLQSGRVYPQDQARRALAGFFRRGNLLALRQLALRQAASRVGDQVDEFRDEQAMPQVWAAAGRLLVAVGPSPLSERLVRVASRMARSMDVPWHAVTVRSDRLRDGADLERAFAHLRLAEQLGAETATLSAEDAADALVAHARRINATMLVLGAPVRRRPWDHLRPSLLDEVITRATDVEVHVVTASADDLAALGIAAPPAREAGSRTPLRWGDGLLALLAIGGTTALATWFEPWLSESDVIMLYLAAVIVSSFRLPRGASAIAAVFAALAFNFFFTEPRFTLYVHDSAYWLTFLIVGAVGLLVSTLASRVRRHARQVQAREREARELYRLARRLALCQSGEEVAQVTAEQVRSLFTCEVSVLVPGAGGLRAAAGDPDPGAGELDRVTAEWVLAHGEAAGAGTHTLPGAHRRYLPLPGRTGCVGVLGLARSSGMDDPEGRRLLETVASLAGEYLDRLQVEREARASRLQAESERLRSTLLQSVSHDLRTPLATVTGAVTTLLDRGARLDEETRHELLQRIAEESRRLERMLEGVLHMTRLDSGTLRPTLEWELPDELVGAAVARVAPFAAGRTIIVHPPPEPFLARLDAVLIEQLLTNYLENALLHGSSDAPVEISVRLHQGEVIFEVADRGPGLPPGDPARLFDKFVRGPGARRGGSGLGLAISQAAARLHGGRTWARPREGGGAVFVAAMPQGVGGSGELPEVESILHTPPSPDPDPP
ncbi:sensor histidine kinase KdpD [Myxococcota bacterium]|nr:sensor histidine kinase KdpD [Myxococcota bacterium]